MSKIRSTGPRSLNSHIHGHCEDIAEQRRVPKGLVYMYLCMRLMEEDVIPPDDSMGIPLPQHESRWSEAAGATAVTLLHSMADEWHYWLLEYGENGVAEKVWYGGAKP